MRHAAILISVVCGLCVGTVALAADDTTSRLLPSGSASSRNQIIWDTNSDTSSPAAPSTALPTNHTDVEQHTQGTSDNPSSSGPAGAPHVIWDTEASTPPPAAPPITSSAAPPTDLLSPGQSNQAVSGSPSPPGQSGDTHITWDDQREEGEAPPPSTTMAASTRSTCREFERNIVIDGREQLARGTMCKRADGRWHIVN